MDSLGTSHTERSGAMHDFTRPASDGTACRPSAGARGEQHSSSAAVVDPQGRPDDLAAEFDAACAARDEMKRWARRLFLHVDDVRVFLDNGFRLETIPSANDFSRRQMLAYLKKNGGPPPKWVRVSGLWPETKGGIVVSPESRRKRVRALYKATLLLVRRELARHEADPDRAERSVFWDPVVGVCRELEIAPSKLSALLKELSGHSLTQVIDNVRAERIRRRLLGEMRQFIGEFKMTCGETEEGQLQSTTRGSSETATHCAGLGTGLDAWEVWKGLKASRKWPEYSQNSWAQGMGFSSYRRLYRACVSVYGKTPHQLEMELIREILAEEESEGEKVDAPDFVEWNVAEIDRAVREIGEYGEG